MGSWQLERIRTEHAERPPNDEITRGRDNEVYNGRISLFAGSSANSSGPILMPTEAIEGTSATAAQQQVSSGKVAYSGYAAQVTCDEAGFLAAEKVETEL